MIASSLNIDCPKEAAVINLAKYADKKFFRTCSMIHILKCLGGRHFGDITKSDLSRIQIS